MLAAKLTDLLMGLNNRMELASAFNKAAPVDEGKKS